MRTLTIFLKNNKYNMMYYFTGFLILGFSVNIMKASGFGNGAWNAVAINIRYFFNNLLHIEWITIGMVSFGVSFIILVIVISYRRSSKYLLMILPIFLVSMSIDFWNMILFYDRMVNELFLQTGFYLIGIIILPLGLTLIIKSSFPAAVFDELMLMFVKITRAKKITYVRLSIEAIGMIIAIIFGYLTFYHVDHSFGAVNLGSLIVTFTISPLMAFYFKVLSVDRE